MIFINRFEQLLNKPHGEVFFPKLRMNFKTQLFSLLYFITFSWWKTEISADKILIYLFFVTKQESFNKSMDVKAGVENPPLTLDSLKQKVNPFFCAGEPVSNLGPKLEEVRNQITAGHCCIQLFTHRQLSAVHVLKRDKRNPRNSWKSIRADWRQSLPKPPFSQTNTRSHYLPRWW